MLQSRFPTVRMWGSLQFGLTTGSCFQYQFSSTHTCGDNTIFVLSARAPNFQPRTQVLHFFLCSDCSCVLRPSVRLAQAVILMERARLNACAVLCLNYHKISTSLMPLAKHVIWRALGTATAYANDLDNGFWIFWEDRNLYLSCYLTYLLIWLKMSQVYGN